MKFLLDSFFGFNGVILYLIEIAEIKNKGSRYGSP